MVEHSDALGNRTRYEYDANGQRTAVVLPEGQKSVSTYDAVGNLKTHRDFNGVTTQYVYDERNRLKTLDLPTDVDVAYTYTPTGNRQTVTDSRGTTTYAYDVRERLVSRIDPAGTSPLLASGKTIEYRYDDAGNVVEVKTAAGITTSGYDAQNRLATVTDAGKQTQYVYDLAGNLAETQLPNGVVEKRSYDDLNRLKGVENVRGSEVLSKFEYTLDDAGNRTQVKESVRDALTGELVVRTVNYGYDDLSRLTSETVLDAAGTVTRRVDYTYDDVGNRLRQTDSAGTTSYVYDKNDRLLSESGVTNATYTYDNNGNTRTVTQGGQTTTYTWDNRNRMTQVQSPTGTTQYTYDDENIRTSSRVGTQTTQFLLDGNRDYSQVLAEAKGGTVQASYTYGLDLVSQKRGGTESFYLVDGLGSTRGLTNAAGNLTDSYTYDAFGNLVGSSGSTSNSYLFAGEQYDSNLDQYYLRQRFYDAGTGRFTRKDTFEGDVNSPISLHKYLYGNGNPVNYTDPTGLYSFAEANAAISISNILDSIHLESGSRFIASTLNSGDSEEGEFFQDFLVSAGAVGGMIFFSLALKNWIRVASIAESGIDDVVRVYRVEGEVNTRLIISELGEVLIQGDGTFFLTFGQRSNAEVYLKNRLNKYPDSQLKSFEVPRSYVDDLRARAVPERASRKRAFRDRPIKVHPRREGDYGLRSQEDIEQLRRAIIQGSGRVES
jgi:RHS repeat-associated protein